MTESQNEQWKDNLEAKGMVFVDRSNRRFSDIMEDKAKKQGLSWRNPGPSKIKLVKREKPLKDVVLYVTKKLEHLAGNMQKMVTELGGSFMVHYNRVKVTHVVFIGRQFDLNKEFKLAKEQKKLIVHPDWVQMCFDEKKRIEETLFQHNYNPKKSLNISVKTAEKPILPPAQPQPSGSIG